MRIKFNAAWLPVFVFSSIILLVLDLTLVFSGSYPGKWYGWYCPEVEEADLAGLYRGDAFSDQVAAKIAFLDSELKEKNRGRKNSTKKESNRNH